PEDAAAPHAPDGWSVAPATHRHCASDASTAAHRAPRRRGVPASAHPSAPPRPAALEPCPSPCRPAVTGRSLRTKGTDGEGSALALLARRGNGAAGDHRDQIPRPAPEPVGPTRDPLRNAVAGTAGWPPPDSACCPDRDCAPRPAGA